MKKTISILTIVSLMSLSLAGAAFAFGDESYFANHPTSVDELTKVWGQPLQVVQSDDGAQVLVFDKHANNMPYENRYFVVRDGQVVDGGMNYHN